MKKLTITVEVYDDGLTTNVKGPGERQEGPMRQIRFYATAANLGPYVACVRVKPGVDTRSLAEHVLPMWAAVGRQMLTEGLS